MSQSRHPSYGMKSKVIVQYGQSLRELIGIPCHSSLLTSGLSNGFQPVFLLLRHRLELHKRSVACSSNRTASMTGDRRLARNLSNNGKARARRTKSIYIVETFCVSVLFSAFYFQIIKSVFIVAEKLFFVYSL